MRITQTADLWWKNAVVYCLDPETFFDSDGDGVGDLAGLAQRIDHLAELGVTCLWLMPFYPTAEKDDGYDITDQYGVDPRLGNAGDVVELIRTAADRGIRVIADLVVNHTSDQHPWFVEARKAKDNPYRDYYVWRSDPPPDTSDQVVFPDQEDSIWELDEATGEWYLHRFYKHQPDLNIANPLVRDEIAKVIGYWLQLGLSGFRVDAVPYMIETVGLDEGEEARYGDPHVYLASLRQLLARRQGSAILLGEVNLPYPEARTFFGDGHGDELTMLFDFVGNQAMYLSLARQDATPLADALRARPEIPIDAHWATFVRNHDELTLDKLTEDERQEVFAAFGPDEDLQLFGRGLRRRLPTMLGGDPRRIRCVYSLLFALPGTPTLFYGEEIGMGENLELEGRLAVRSPMQWTDEPNGGFSTADAADLCAPVTQGGFGPEFVNVRAQRRDPDSLMSHVTRLVQRYRECPELGWAPLCVLEQPHAAVLALRSTVDDDTVVTLHNLGDEPVTVPLDLSDLPQDRRLLVDLLQDASTPVGDDGRVELTLEGYGYRWLRAAGPGMVRLL
ncbi:alpha-amylase family protein [Cellulomonas marina]|uniref:Alpha-amylase n=1 Tax=Cellulomonas marina TaxID=988821 RepID=A0A1I0WPN8_9CELL|nr:alpha-amylase family protein [Cellulomonas marina]GIG27786.1 alpha-amylase [Cellulomonas marina]SFA90504.1 trehalose synthase [Cellulomonas marina]